MSPDQRVWRLLAFICGRFPNVGLDSQIFVSLLRIVKNKRLAAPVLQSQINILAAIMTIQTCSHRAQRSAARFGNEPANVRGQDLLFGRTTVGTPLDLCNFVRVESDPLSARGRSWPRTLAGSFPKRAAFR